MGLVKWLVVSCPATILLATGQLVRRGQFSLASAKIYEASLGESGQVLGSGGSVFATSFLGILPWPLPSGKSETKNDGQIHHAIDGKTHSLCRCSI